MRSEIKGIGVDVGWRKSDWLVFGLGVLLIPAGAGLLIAPGSVVYFSLRRGKITIDTELDLVQGRGWSVKLSEIDEYHGEEIWTHSAKDGSSRVNYITLVGDFGSKRVAFKNKDKHHEFLNRLKKASEEIKNS